MLKHGKIYTLITIVVFLAVGCVFTVGRFERKDISKVAHEHRAAKMYHEGVWNLRFSSYGGNDATGETTMQLSVNVYKDMTKEDMLEVMDYYELVGNAAYSGGGRYLGERETDYSSWGIFYRGDTDEALMRIKYVNGQEVEVTEDDKWFFPAPYRQKEEDFGMDLWM